MSYGMRCPNCGELKRLEYDKMKNTYYCNRCRCEFKNLGEKIKDESTMSELPYREGRESEGF